MKIQINPLSYREVFTLPAEVANRLRLAGENQLRLIIWVFSQRLSEFEIPDAAKALKISEDAVTEAVLFWKEAGLLTGDAEEAREIKAPAVQKTRVSKIKRTPERPTRAEAVKRGNESEELRLMLTELQKKLRRTINSNELISFVWMHDSLGLPAEVIMMLTEYCAGEDKGNIRYIEKVAAEWAENDIDSIEKAEEMLKADVMSREAWGKVMRAFGISPRQPSAKELKFSDAWVNEWGFSSKMLKAAYDECIDHSDNAKLSFAYINKILTAWHTKGFKTPEETRSAKTAPSAGKKAADSSIDIGEFSSALKKRGARKEN